MAWVQYLFILEIKPRSLEILIHSAVQCLKKREQRCTTFAPSVPLGKLPLAKEVKKYLTLLNGVRLSLNFSFSNSSTTLKTDSKSINLINQPISML